MCLVRLYGVESVLLHCLHVVTRGARGFGGPVHPNRRCARRLDALLYVLPQLLHLTHGTKCGPGGPLHHDLTCARKLDKELNVLPHVLHTLDCAAGMPANAFDIRYKCALVILRCAQVSTDRTEVHE